LPEIALGVFAPAASAILPLRVGATRAARALLTGEPRPASDWRDWGLVEDIAPAGALDAAIDRWFDRHLAPRSALALAYAAEAARLGLREQVDRLLPELERVYLYRLMRSQDAAEGVAAFLEKRTPHWCDR
jgi:cyclohexa-1,5-dienecarbonyl-CoA hydratase